MPTKFDLRKQVDDAALAAGIPILSGDKCCQLLAWVYKYGGGHEQVVLDERLCNTILYAQQRLNIYGGEEPNLELLPVLQNYIKTLTDYDNPPDWVLALEKECNIKAYRGKK